MKKGRVTIPTNLDVVPQTLEILVEWGADAIRDCDGTEPIIQPVRIMNGQRHILRKSSRCIS